jgi:Xaa-Pro aminopeptidase
LIKSKEEQEVIRIAGQIASPAMTRMIEALLSGKTEAEAAGLAAHDIVSAGGVIDKIQVSHGDTIGFTCGDPLTGYRTVAPENGDLFRAFLIGPMYQGYYLDPGRTAVCGNKPNLDQTNLLEACENIISTMAASIKPGVSFEDAAKVGDKMVADFGPDADPAAEKFPFFGHPHGLYFEGPPYISTVLEHKDAIFETGMLIGLEAFLARKGVGNVGFEQNYLVNENGLELITTTPLLWH